MSETNHANAKCIFCNIANGRDDKASILFQNEELVVFRDIKPATKHHYLVVTREHIKNPKQLDGSHVELVDRMVKAGEEYFNSNAEQADKEDKISYGFHWPPFNSIQHLHLHVIGCTSQMGFLSRMIFRPNSYWYVSSEWLINRLKSMQANS